MLNKELIDKLANGEIALQFDNKKDNLDNLKIILGQAFPSDLNKSAKGVKFYYAGANMKEKWFGSDFLPSFLNDSQIVEINKFFLKEDFEVGETILVRDSLTGTWSERVFLAMVKEPINQVITLGQQEDIERFKQGKNVIFGNWKFYKRKTIVELTIKEIAEKFGLLAEEIRIKE